ncbi:MAG: hypothetical protein RL346_816 [Verrucomicrobiota bacterium]|jgi:hypothetical protein
MKTLNLLIVACVSSIALSNCTAPTGPNTQRGAVAGGLLGAAAGAVVGHQTGRTLEGAAVGGALGAGTGAVLGNSQDQKQGY